MISPTRTSQVIECLEELRARAVRGEPLDTSPASLCILAWLARSDINASLWFVVMQSYLECHRARVFAVRAQFSILDSRA